MSSCQNLDNGAWMASERTMATLPSYLRSLIDGVQDGFVLRSVDGTIIEVNQAFLDLVGFDRDEVIGTRPPHPWWLLDENDVGLSDRYFRGAASEERAVYATRMAGRSRRCSPAARYATTVERSSALSARSRMSLTGQRLRSSWRFRRRSSTRRRAR